MDATLPVKFVDISVADHRSPATTVLRRTPMGRSEAHLGLAHGMKLLRAREMRPQRIDEPDGRAKKERRHRREIGMRADLHKRL